MRTTPTALAVGLLVPALSALPVVTAPAATAHPVTPELRTQPLSGVATAALRAPAGRASAAVARQAWAQESPAGTARPATGLSPLRPAVLTAKRHTAAFQMLGVTWRESGGRAGGRPDDVTVVVRAHGARGWTAWTPLDLQDQPSAHDASARAGTEPLWVGTSDGYQVRVDVHSGTLPRDLRVDLVAPGSSAADGSPGGARPAASAEAAVGHPTIYSRAAWGADERLRGGGPSYTSTIKTGFVHHTAGTNNYSQSDVPKIIRGIYAYHTKGNGWSDIGYNFLVDRFGRLWEGRYGGINRPVLGAHTGGFNNDSFAVSAIGDYQKVAAPAVMVDAIARLMAWKLSLYYRDPNGHATLTSVGGGTSRYPAGRNVVFNVISGHRDAGYTECPGKNLYRQLPTIRELTAGYLGAALVDPGVSSATTRYSGGPLTVTADTLHAQSWRLTVREHWQGTVVRTLTGTASPGDPVAATWNLDDDAGTAVRPGRYDLVLASWDDQGSARSWRRGVTVEAPSTSPPTVAAAALPGATGFVPLRPARVYDSRSGNRLPLGPKQRVDVRVLGVGGVPATGVGAVALTVTAAYPTRDTSLFVWPAGSARPSKAGLQVAAGATRSAMTVVPVGGDGKVSVTDATGTTEVAVDVAGYYPTSAAPDTVTGQLLHPLQPFRLFDSRRDPSGIIPAGGSRTLTLPDQGVPMASIGAVVLNVTTVNADGSGTLTVHKPGSGLTAGVSASYEVGPAVATRAVTAVSTAGRLRIDNRGAATHVIVDVVGWYADPSVTHGFAFHPVRAATVIDTRSGLGGRHSRLGVGTMTMRFGGRAGVPSNAKAVAVELTSVGATRATVLTAWPSRWRRPATSDLNVPAGRTTSNLLVLRLGTGRAAGTAQLASTSGSTHIVAQVLGYWS